MKKFFSLLLVSAGLVLPLVAQDTLYTTSIPSPGYLMNDWPTTTYSQQYTHFRLENHNHTCFRRIVDKPTLVYGIAVITSDIRDLIHDIMIRDYGVDLVSQSADGDSAYNYYTLWEANDLGYGVIPHKGMCNILKPDIHSNSSPLKIISDSLYVHEDTTPQFYFYYDDSVANYYDYLDKGYERWFKEPILVDDSFYVGTTGRGYYVYYLGRTPMMQPTSVGCHLGPSSVNSRIAFYEISCFWYSDRNSDHTFLFPILSPNPNIDTTTYDTVSHDTVFNDSVLVIGMAELIGRYITLQPNPASSTVRVLSGTTMQKIDAYSSSGQLLKHWDVDGLTTTLDVSTLPKGVHLLHITTTLGITTKKLVIQ